MQKHLIKIKAESFFNSENHLKERSPKVQAQRSEE